ncbi:hypothetical protein AVEN_14272-1 [Araneus ventricosus]|uniref:Uncharacterized protein n=1 Tax=Araneus ventricosus TaxID=182803 RepID=A0A4Y2XAZ0_ARAVE|nr:hypothetical protein AVEN_14272-1 [Araneus ventricosus]
MKDGQIKTVRSTLANGMAAIAVANTLEQHITGLLTNQIRLSVISALSEIGTISICREFPIGKFSSEKLLINISFSDQIYQNGNRFSDTDLKDMVSKILDQFPMKGQAKKR